MKTHPVLKWIASGLRKPAVLYWTFAFFILTCVQAPQLWTLLPFIVGAVVYRSYRNSAIAKAALRDKATTATEPELADMPDVDVFTQPAPIFELVPAPASQERTIHDPIVVIPAVYSQAPNYDQYKEPTWKRRGIDITALFISSTVTPPTESTPFPKIHDPDEGAMDHAEESGGVFLYS